MNYTVPYNGTFCSKNKILKKRTPSKSAMQIRDYCMSHPLSASKTADGSIIFKIKSNGESQK